MLTDARTPRALASQRPERRTRETDCVRFSKQREMSDKRNGLCPFLQATRSVAPLSPPWERAARSKTERVRGALDLDGGKQKSRLRTLTHGHCVSAPSPIIEGEGKDATHPNERSARRALRQATRNVGPEKRAVRFSKQRAMSDQGSGQRPFLQGTRLMACVPLSPPVGEGSEVEDRAGEGGVRQFLSSPTTQEKRLPAVPHEIQSIDADSR